MQDAYTYNNDDLKFDQVLSIYQEIFSMLTTTSPNALLLASLDSARHQASEERNVIQLTSKLVLKFR